MQLQSLHLCHHHVFRPKGERRWNLLFLAQNDLLFFSSSFLGSLFLHQVYHNKSATLFLDFTLSETTTTTKHEENMSKSQLRCSSVRNSKPLLSFMITLGERLLFACFFPALPAVLPLLPESQFIFSVMNSFGK